MKFGRKHVEIKLFLYELATFLKYHMPLNCIESQINMNSLNYNHHPKIM